MVCCQVLYGVYKAFYGCTWFLSCFTQFLYDSLWFHMVSVIFVLFSFVFLQSSFVFLLFLRFPMLFMICLMVFSCLFVFLQVSYGVHIVSLGCCQVSYRVPYCSDDSLNFLMVFISFSYGLTQFSCQFSLLFLLFSLYGFYTVLYGLYTVFIWLL